jgi:hypothetical protein
MDHFLTILYSFKLITYNPLLPLLIAIIAHILLFILVIDYNKSTIDLIYYIIVFIFCESIFPIYLLRNHLNFPKQSEIFYSVGLLIIYLGWLTINGQNVITIYKKLIMSLINNTHEAPDVYLIFSLHEYLKSIINKH